MVYLKLQTKRVNLYSRWHHKTQSHISCLCLCQYEDPATSPEHWRFLCCCAGEESPHAVEQKISQGTSSQTHLPRPVCITHLFSVTNHGWDFLSSLSAHLPSCCLKLRKDTSSLSAAQTGDSPSASIPADNVKEGEGEGQEEKVCREAEEEAPKGASLAQETPAIQDGVCGWVILIQGALNSF